jgi:SAM-dependent methyltransferase
MATATEAAPLTVTPPPAGEVSLQPQSAADRFLIDRRTLALFLISVVGLFLELLLIRWISTEIRIFAYLQNTVLVVCFLGLGMGCWDCRRGFALRDLLVPLVVLVALLALPPSRAALGSISAMLGQFSDLLIWYPWESSGWKLYASVGIGLVLTFGFMILLWEMFVPVGRLLGRLMNEHPNTIWAYSVNVAGSLVGIWLFVAASGFYLPPVAWFALFAAGAFVFAGTGGRSKRVDLGILGTIVALAALAGHEPGWDRMTWSPYQKLSVKGPGEAEHSWLSMGISRVPESVPEGAYYVSVNNCGYQIMLDLSASRVEKGDPRIYNPEQRGLSQYDIPPKLHPNPESVLIVGAGAGNDAAGALRDPRVKRVVAVEIDPAIIAYGREFHTEKPYADPRCVVVNDDARSYFATSAEKFDVIAFGLLDSHTTTAMTNARLDHYVYTTESLEQAKKLLKPGGVAVLSFESTKPYMTDRMGTALERVFGHRPVAFRAAGTGYAWGGTMFVVGESEQFVRERIAAEPRLAALIAKWQAEMPIAITGKVKLATDDWPYIYLEKPTIPVLYYLLAGVLALLFARGVWRLEAGSAIRAWGGSNWHFFFLGAGFMLLEVQNVSKAAVVLGNTWVVNAVIISGVMVMILLANLIAARFPRLPMTPVYGLLVASCLGLYLLDLSTFAFLPYATKAALVGLLTSLPMLFSGIVFVRSFAAAERKDSALGANLIGALVGGLLQTVTFVTGIKALLLIVAALYLAAVLTRPQKAEKPAEAVA